MATVIQEADDPVLFRLITDRNLLTQYDVMEISVRVGLAEKIEGVSHDLIKEFNRVVTRYLCESPGLYRQAPIYIRNSPHAPPDHWTVQAHMDEMVRYVFDNWTSKDAIHLAAYCLWWLNWTHPFIEGNGRTARAISYYILCIKLGLWMPGDKIIPQQIRADRAPYYAALRAADLAYASGAGSLDVSKMEEYLTTLLTVQLS